MSSTSSASWSEFTSRLFRQNQFAIKLGLDNMRRAFACEGHPERSHRAIVVAGTNGKGSVCAHLAAILQGHGLRVGLYTSPHLIDLRERFRVDGRPLGRAQVERVGTDILDRYGDPAGELCLTFFELTTLMAARLFAECAVDVAIYEVGLGGRLDAVNAIEPSLSVVTTIDLDHQAYLGDTIEAVAAEKAGIFRAGTDALVGYQDHEQAASTLAALAPARTRWFGRDFDDRTLREQMPDAPRVRWRNLATAVAAAETYLGSRFDAALAHRALERARWPGRMDLREVEVDGIGPMRLLFDAAHNPAGVRELFHHLGTLGHPVGAVVVGAMRDKDARPMFEPLATLGAPVFGCTLDENPRARDGRELATVVPASVFRGAGTCRQALEWAARERRTVSDVVLVFGSIYLLGACFEAIGIETDALVTYVHDEIVHIC